MTSEGHFKDRMLICVGCGGEFVFTVDAQRYFAEHGCTEEPKRCKDCYVHFHYKLPIKDIPSSTNPDIK